MKQLSALILLMIFATACATYTKEEQREWANSHDPQGAYTPYRGQ